MVDFNAFHDVNLEMNFFCNLKLNCPWKHAQTSKLLGMKAFPLKELMVNINLQSLVYLFSFVV